MPNRKEHTRLSRSTLGKWSMGEWFQRILDEHSRELGPRHRAIDHSLERLKKLSRMYGEIGNAEILIHLTTDYGLVPAWERRVKRK